ncbi:hypothetical protein AAG906_015346 [Vitis piasezkii]
MAEGTVTFFAEKLSNLILQEASVFGQVEGQIKLLRNELEWMRLFLKDADSKRIYDERIKLWVNQIRNATHDAEDVIDEFILNMDHRQRRLNTLKLLKCLPTCVGFADKLPFIHELDSRVKDINVMIGAIMANRSKYGLGDLVASSSSTTDQSDVVGIEDGTEEVKQMLMKEETRRSVVSIVGMGGLGKTTLAKKVYNQRDVQQHFDCKAWVYVSQEFRAREILLDIANHFMSLSEKEKEMRESELGEKICEYLKEKKYLVVMDDVWSSEVWSRLRSHLPEAKDGSKVLITTRNKEIALHATSQAFIYELRLMNDDESWQLFLKKTFQGTSTPHTLSRKNCGKMQRFASCGCGLRRLIVHKEKTKPSWEKVLASTKWHPDQGLESVYTEKGKETLEDIVEDYMHELIHRNGEVGSCRMHDLFRDLAVLEAKDANFLRCMKTLISHSLLSLNLGSNFGGIPYSIWKLQQLRHLICGNFKISSQSKTSKCVNGYLGVEQLTNLQTLALKRELVGGSVGFQGYGNKN